MASTGSEFLQSVGAGRSVVPVAQVMPVGGEQYRIWYPWELRMEQAAEHGGLDLHWYVSPGTSQLTCVPINLAGCRDFDLHMSVMPGGTGNVKLYCLGMMQNAGRTMLLDYLSDGLTAGTQVNQNASYATAWHWSTRSSTFQKEWRYASPLWIQPQFLFSAAKIPIIFWITGRY